MKRILITIILAGLLLLMMPAAVVSAAGVTVTGKTGDGVWIDNTWQVEIYPGESKSTAITLYNSSGSSLDVEVSVIPDSYDNGNLTFGLDKIDFVMSGRSYDDVTLTVEASGSAIPGTYTTELTIKSEVPPRPTPVTPVVVEPEEEEPTEPVEPEPEPVTPEEPVIPVPPVEPFEPEEPIPPEKEVVLEPEPVEPEEPAEPEDITLVEEPCRWSLLDSILAGLVLVMLGLDIWQWRKRRQRV